MPVVSRYSQLENIFLRVKFPKWRCLSPLNYTTLLHIQGAKAVLWTFLEVLNHLQAPPWRRLWTLPFRARSASWHLTVGKTLYDVMMICDTVRVALSVCTTFSHVLFCFVLSFLNLKMIFKFLVSYLQVKVGVVTTVVF